MKIKLLVAVALMSALVLGGCGSDDSESGPASSSPSESDVTQQKFDVSWHDALDKARDDFDGDVSKIELEQNDEGQYEYKVELMSDDQKFAMQIDADSGDVVDTKTDDFDEDKQSSERDEKTIDLDQVISVNKAANAARDAHDGPVNKWKLEGKSGGAQYEFDITKDSGDEDWEVQIDAESGEVIED